MEFTTIYRSRMVIKAIAPFISTKDKILDIGCGNGVISYEIKNFFNCQLIGIDILDYLKRDIMFKKMIRYDRLDFDDDEFNIALFIDSLHHMSFENQVKLIKAALRISPQVLIFELKDTILSKTADYFLNKIHNRDMPILFTHRDEKEWMKLFDGYNINYRFYEVEKPIFAFPLTYYLFYLYR